MGRKVLQPWRLRQEARPAALTASQLSRLLLQPAGGLTEVDREAFAHVLQAHPLLAQGYDLKVRVQTLVAQRDQPAFDQRLQAADASELPPFQTVARRVRQDSAAIIAGRTTPWRTGQGEGQICRVKLLKRRGYGRAKLDVLRQRSWHRRVPLVTPAGHGRQAQRPLAASRQAVPSDGW
jgi:transposase